MRYLVKPSMLITEAYEGLGKV